MFEKKNTKYIIDENLICLILLWLIDDLIDYKLKFTRRDRRTNFTLND